MHLDAPGVAEADGLLQAVCIKIAGARAGVEARKAQIYRVCPAEYGGAQHFFTAHGARISILAIILLLTACCCTYN